MSLTFGIEVEHVHYALLLNTEKRNQGSIDLTTLADNQKKALIRVFLFEKHKKTLVHTIELSPLPRKPAGKPRITCRGEFTSNRFLHITVSLEGKNLYTGDVDVKKYRKRGGWWLIPLFLIIAGGGIAAALVMTGDNREDGKMKGLLDTERPEPESISETSEKSTEQERAAPAAETETEDSGVEAAERQQTAVQQPEQQTAAVEAEQEDETRTSPGTVETAVVDVQKELVYFLPESPVLLDAAKKTLQELRDQMRNTNAKIRAIEGHCALFDTEESREQLSEKRAENVYDYLQQIGAPFSENPEIRGFGGREPVTRSIERQELNRRVEIIIETTINQE